MSVPNVFMLTSIFLSFKGVDCNSCGNLNYTQPAIKGRNVTILFTPIKHSDTEMPTIFYSVGDTWIALRSTIISNSTSGVFSTVVDTNLQITASAYMYAKYSGCSSQHLHLKIQDLSGGCGYIYLRTPSPVVGKTVEIGYYPAPAVIGLTGEYVREWYNESSRSSMNLVEGVLSEKELPNKEFVLTIHNSTRWTTGNYTVKCTNRTPKNRYTKHVYVKVIVPPGQPFLLSKKIVQDCPECLVGVLGENLYSHVSCTTSRDTLPSINIGGEGGKVYRDKDLGNVYRISRIIREEDHMKTVTCSVLNAALKQPLTTSAKLFVAKKTKTPVLNVPILREGYPANITCISRNMRPATNLSLWLDGKYASVDDVTTSHTSTRTFTTTITLSKLASKGWNGKVVSCSLSSQLFGDRVTRQKTINCTYPPSELSMDVPSVPKYLKDIYNLECRCFTDNYNDICWISWTKDGQPLQTNGYERSKLHDLSSMVFVNVTKENYSPTITCNVMCSNFDVQLSKSHVVQVPYQPSIYLSVKDEVLLNAHETTIATCTANSQPPSDIVWSVNGDTQLLVCNKTKECEIHTHSVDTNEHRNYTCTAYFELGNYSTTSASSFMAIGRASTQKPNEDDSLTNSKDIPTEGIVVGSCVFIAAVIISIAIVSIRRRRLKEKRHGYPNEPQPVQHANVQENEAFERNEDVTYAQVDKSATKMTKTEGNATKGSNGNLLYADIDVDHLETARKSQSKARPSTPTEYVDIDFIRTERGQESENIYMN